MQYLLLLFALLLTTSVFAQDELSPRFGSNKTENSVIEMLDLQRITTDKAPDPALELVIEDVDDLTASFAPVENLEFYATASNLFDLEMSFDRFDEEQLVDHTPKAIDETYPVEGSSRFISAGLRFTF